MDNYKPSKSTLHYYCILNCLSNNKDIIIVKPDKGSGNVILNKTDYQNMILMIKLSLKIIMTLLNNEKDNYKDIF